MHHVMQFPARKRYTFAQTGANMRPKSSVTDRDAPLQRSRFRIRKWTPNDGSLK